MVDNIFITCKINLEVPVGTKREALAVLDPKRGNLRPGQLAKTRYNEINGANGDGWKNRWLKEHDQAEERVKAKIDVYIKLLDTNGDGTVTKGRLNDFLHTPGIAEFYSEKTLRRMVEDRGLKVVTGDASSSAWPPCNRPSVLDIRDKDTNRTAINTIFDYLVSLGCSSYEEAISRGLQDYLGKNESPRSIRALDAQQIANYCSSIQSAIQAKGLTSEYSTKLSHLCGDLVSCGFLSNQVIRNQLDAALAFTKTDREFDWASILQGPLKDHQLTLAQFNLLRDQAIKLGMSEDVANWYVQSKLEKNHDSPFKGSAPVKRKYCCICDTYSDPKATACEKCGSPFEISCPKCGKTAELSFTSRVCHNCGFPVINFVLAKTELQAAKKSMDASNFDATKEHIDQLKVYWPRGESFDKKDQDILKSVEKWIETIGLRLKNQEETKIFNGLTQPGHFVAKATNAGILLSWDGVVGADGYLIVRQENRAPSDYHDGVPKRVGVVTHWTDSDNLMFGKRYVYSIYPTRGEGDKGVKVDKNSVSLPILWMQAVTGLRGSGRDDQITLWWTLPKISSPYSVRLIRRHDGREESIKLNESEYSGPYSDSNVTKGGAYSYRVVVNVGGKDVPSEGTPLIVAKTPAITGDITNREFVRRGRSVFVTWSWVPGVDKVIVSHTAKPQGTELPLSSLVEGRDFDICRRSDNSRGIEVMLKLAQTFIGVYPYNEVEARAAESDRLFLVEQRRIAITTKRSWLGRCEGLIFAGLQKGTHGGWLPEFVINARDVKNYTVEEIGRSSEIDSNGHFKVPDQYRKGYEFTFECKSKTDNSNYSFEKM